MILRQKGSKDSSITSSTWRVCSVTAPLIRRHARHQKYALGIAQDRKLLSALFRDPRFVVQLFQAFFRRCVPRDADDPQADGCG